MASDYGIVIAGGGPIGAAVALGLRASGQRIVVLEARAPDAVVDDARMIALSHGSRLILERLGVWTRLTDLTPIHSIVVSRAGSFGRVELTADEARVPALGYVAPYAGLQRALTSAVEGEAIELLTGCRACGFTADAERAHLVADGPVGVTEFDARLVVLADGADGLQLGGVSERDYRQSALVCEVTSSVAHCNRAFERFTAHGPLALLPSSRGWSLVWTTQPQRALELAALDERRFCDELHTSFGAMLGDFTLAGGRQVFPLKLKYAKKPLARRVVLVGNAAQSLHPVAGQGFNLGLRDAWELARALRDAPDPGAFSTLNTYYSERRFDRTATILFTDSLIRLFSNDIPILDRLSGAGIAALSALPPAKKMLVRWMMFGARG